MPRVVFRRLVVIILAVTVTLLDGCLVNPCEATVEPSLIVQFYNANTARAYSKVASLDGKVKFDNILNYVKLPLSLNDDALTYIFISNNKVDTISISYQRNFKFQSARCGFTVSLENIKIVKPTSFKIFFGPELSNLNRGEYSISLYD